MGVEFVRMLTAAQRHQLVFNCPLCSLLRIGVVGVDICISGFGSRSRLSGILPEHFGQFDASFRDGGTLGQMMDQPHLGATVEITFDQQSFADSGLSFGSWEIDGLSNSEYYKNKESFTFTMPKNRVAVTATTMDIPIIDDSPVDPGISTAVTIIGGALLVGGLHQLGTEMWLIHHLPKGTAVLMPGSTGESSMMGISIVEAVTATRFLGIVKVKLSLFL